MACIFSFPMNRLYIELFNRSLFLLSDPIVLASLGVNFINFSMQLFVSKLVKTKAMKRKIYFVLQLLRIGEKNIAEEKAGFELNISSIVISIRAQNMRFLGLT